QADHASREPFRSASLPFSPTQSSPQCRVMWPGWSAAQSGISLAIAPKPAQSGISASAPYPDGAAAGSHTNSIVFRPDDLFHGSRSRPPLPHRNPEIAETVNLQGVAGHQHRRRCMLLDQRRTLDAIASGERIAPEGTGVDEAVTVEVDGPLTSTRRLGRGRTAARDFVQDGLAHDARHRGAQTDDFGALQGRVGAIAQEMHVVEVALDRGAILFVEHPQRQVDRHRMLLADIAHIGGAADQDLFGRHRGTGDGAPAFALQFAVDAG